MSVSWARGIRLGTGTALLFSVVTPINNWLRHEPVSLDKILVGSACVFLLSGLFGTLTDKIGSDVGDV